MNVLLCTTQISRGIESLFNKLRAELQDPAPEWTASVDCNDCRRLALCTARLEQLIRDMSKESIFRDIIAKMQCTLFQVCQCQC